MNLVLDPFEIADHSVGIQFFCLAEDRYDPIMAVQLLALAFVGEGQPMASRDLHSF